MADDKVDRGFCISYWKLSHRRKFIRTTWLMPLVAALLFWFVNARGRGPKVACGIVVLCLVVGTVQAIYEYRAWQKEKGSPIRHETDT